jgi:tetratricopeptide (TPR) repeat protein
LRSAIAIFKERRDLHGLADALIRSGEVHRNQGADEKARVAYDDALAAVDGHQLPALAARALSGLGELLRKRERWAEAQAALAKAIDMKRAAGDPDLADLHASLGGALEGAGDYSAAEAKYRESLMGFEASGNEAGVADAADHLGQVCLMQSKLEDAEENFEKSAITFESVQLIDAAADAYVSLARVQDQRGDLSAAELSFKNALALTDRRMEADPGEARDEIYRSLEVIYAKQGSPPRTA